MGNQAECFEDGGTDHATSDQASLDAKHDADGNLIGHTHGDINEHSHDAEENGQGNADLEAVLPDGGTYEENGEGEGADADRHDTNSPSGNVDVGTAKKKKKSKSKSKSKRGLVKPTRTNDGVNPT